MAHEDTDTKDRGARGKLRTRARFLGLFGGGAAFAYLGSLVVMPIDGWRYNIVEDPRPTFDPADYPPESLR